MNLDRFNFRWFDKKLGFMAQVKYLNIDDDYALVRYSYADEYTPDEEIKISDGILMQSTGLKDKNDKMIYEGDIVDSYIDIDYECGKSLGRGVVIFIQDNLSLCSFEITGFDKTKQLIHDYSHTIFEVICNIHENPELLKK